MAAKCFSVAIEWCLGNVHANLKGISIVIYFRKVEFFPCYASFSKKINTY